MLKSRLEIILGILSILTGLIYVIGLYGPTEAEVSTWGIFAFILGGMLIFLGIERSTNTHNLAKFFVVCLLAIQIPPIILWFTFSGSSISDGTPPSSFVAHWIFATPHLVIVLIGVAVLFFQFKKINT